MSTSSTAPLSPCLLVSTAPHLARRHDVDEHLGQGGVVYEAQPGTGVMFLSELWHRTETTSSGTMKVTLLRCLLDG